ncbi:hypothetical protein SAMN05216436_10283 [bacterium A37T11]|nr:hypothetical protein SAMN05216436_10283 [bacterium A37T11]
MNKIFLYLAALTQLALWSACKEHDFAEGTLSPTISIENLRALYKGSELPLTSDHLMGAYQITGIVISDHLNGNAPAGTVILQQYKRQRLRGISCNLGDVAGTFAPGDSLLINLEGSILTKENGVLTVNGLTDGSVQKLSAGNNIHIQTVTAYTLNTLADQYESTLVTLTGGTIRPTPEADEVYAGEKILISGADSVIVHTEQAATYATEKLPANLTVTGIVRVGYSASSDTVIHIWPRRFEDLVDTSDPSDPSNLGKTPVIITGFVNDAKGADGNYEYFQFMATTDINFEETPFSVITCTNAGTAAPNAGAAPGAGWATGGGRTYKFNLNTGIVSKGEFFYVGGNNKRINGPNSTNIANGKWIRTITYTTTAGDGIGDASAGLLPNSGNAGGIAIFTGTNITESSVPVDVVFFGGTGKTTMVDEANGRGYRIPESDHYGPVDSDTGNGQPFFYQGTNMYVIPHQNPADQGIFVKLGGVFNSADRSWLTPRGYEFYLMTSTSTLTDIESDQLQLIE